MAAGHVSENDLLDCNIRKYKMLSRALNLKRSVMSPGLKSIFSIFDSVVYIKNKTLIWLKAKNKENTKSKFEASNILYS